MHFRRVSSKMPHSKLSAAEGVSDKTLNQAAVLVFQPLLIRIERIRQIRYISDPKFCGQIARVQICQGQISAVSVGTTSEAFDTC